MTKVLVYEDDKTMLNLLNTLLELEGYHVIPFSGQSQEKLLISLTYEKPEVLLLDVHLHHLNGIDILKSIRQNQEHNGLKIIMTSGMDVSGECLSSGADGFLLKPFMPDELISMIQNHSVK